MKSYILIGLMALAADPVASYYAAHAHYDGEYTKAQVDAVSALVGKPKHKHMTQDDQRSAWIKLGLAE